MKPSVVEMEATKGEKEKRQSSEGEYRHQQAHPLALQDLQPEVAWQDCAPLEQQVQHVDHHKGHGDVEEVHAHLAEDLDLKPQLIELPWERIFAEVVEAGVLHWARAGDLVVGVVGGGQEHVVGDQDPWHIVSASVP